MINFSWILETVINAFTSLGLSRDLALRVFIALIILAVGYVVVKIITRITSRILLKLYPRQITIIVLRIIYYSLLFILIVLFLTSLGIDVSGLMLAGGFAGLVVGVALQPVLANVFAGLYIMAEKVVQPGNAVEVGSVSGEVISLSIMFTRIMTWDGIIVTVPNNLLLSSMLKNYSKTMARRIEITVPIAYGEDIEKAYKVIREVVDKYPYTLVEPSPDIFVSSAGDNGLIVTIRAWVPRQYYYQAVKDLPWLIVKAVSNAGIEIPFPQLSIWFKTPLNLGPTSK
ncbi:mechanosensitive ion channel family protein [Desulfurococcus amylolyticus]|uniref:mechanosensitive ion channel family protein n=1 Tax=Desulfurococcus amylolyticus TaxID=94694 RepID=UPI0023F279CC|nr:mechanosensitive ion channel family protein [Desulfurococcus amylolyticus]